MYPPPQLSILSGTYGVYPDKQGHYRLLPQTGRKRKNCKTEHQMGGRVYVFH